MQRKSSHGFFSVKFSELSARVAQHIAFSARQQWRVPTCGASHTDAEPHPQRASAPHTQLMQTARRQDEEETLGAGGRPEVPWQLAEGETVEHVADNSRDVSPRLAVTAWGEQQLRSSTVKVAVLARPYLATIS